MEWRDRGRGDERDIATAVIGWLALACVLMSALPFGSTRPVYWLGLAFVTLVLLGAQIVADRRDAIASVMLRALWPAALAWITVIVWAFVQVLPDAGRWAHPTWQWLDGELAKGAQMTISADPGAGRLIIPRLAAYAALFWIAVRASTRSARAEAMVRAIALFSTGLAIWGLARYSGLGGPVGGAVSATFANTNSYATYAVFGALCNLAAFHGRSDAPRIGGRPALREALERFFAGQWIWFAGFLVCVTAAILTQSRAGAVAGLIGLLVFVVTFAGGSGQRRLSAGLSLAVVAFFAVTAGAGLWARMLGTSGEEVRFAAYPLVVEGILQRPWLGHGLGSFHDVFRALVTPELAVGEWNLAHNSYLENAFELGLPASMLMFAAIGLLLRRIWRGIHDRRRNRVFPCLGAGCAAAAGTHALFDFSLQVPAISALFAFLLGIVWSQSFPRRSIQGRPDDRDRIDASTSNAYE